MLRRLFLFFFPLSLFAFEIAPYFTPVAEFEFRPSYSYRYYPDIDRAENPSHYSSHDHLVDLNLGVHFWPNWDFQIGADVSNTRALSWGLQRLGMQLRYLLLDDVAGDLVSVALGSQIFFVPTRNMGDPSSPYHAQGNLEIGAVIGKEIDQIFNWKYRFYGFFGVGMGNRGHPWLRPLLSAALNFRQEHRFEVFSEGYFGLGKRHIVDIGRLNGYAKICHHSIDVGLKYQYLFEIWGALGIQYAYRVLARSFPEHSSTFVIEYRLPFSIF